MNWDRDRLLMDLNKFSFRAKAVVQGEMAHYYDFYGMNFHQEFADLEQRSGWVDAKVGIWTMMATQPCGLIPGKNG